MARRFARAGEGIDQRQGNLIWPGFVDALTALLLVLIFVLSIFMIVQYLLQVAISGKDRRLEELTGQISELADVLSIERQKVQQSESKIDELSKFVANLTDERDEAKAQSANLEKLLAATITSKEQAEAQVVKAIDERNAISALLASLRDDLAESESKQQEMLAKLDQTESELSEAEKQNALEREAARLLRERLAESTDELTALTLALEKKRAEAEDTLTLLAAAQLAKSDLETEKAQLLSDKEKDQALYKTAQAKIAESDRISEERARKLALLNEQIAQMRAQIAQLGAQLDAAEALDKEQKVQIAKLGSQLNVALARKVSELAKYRSEFFGRMREVLGDRPDIKIVGDRFILQSEVLFDVGSAEIGEDGKNQLSKLAKAIREVSKDIPPELNWVLRVEGHTDKQPIKANLLYADNWELSQARALSVTRYLIDVENIPPARIAAGGFGEFHPIDSRNTQEAYAKNRRIELKFSER